MYNLVSRITDGLGELKKLLESHIHNQGLAAIEKCGDSALNVSPGVPVTVWTQHFQAVAAAVGRSSTFYWFNLSKNEPNWL